MKKTLLMLAFVAATSMVALAHGDDKKEGKKDACCSKEGAKKEMASKSCCSKDGAKTAKVEKTGKAEKVAEKTAAPKN